MIQNCFLQISDNLCHVLFNNRKIRKLNEIRQKEGLCRILIHTDAAQAIGKISVDVEELGVDYLTIVGHKVLILGKFKWSVSGSNKLSSFMGLELELFL